MENGDCMDKFYVPNTFIVSFEIATVFVNTRQAGLVPLYSDSSEKTARQSHSAHAGRRFRLYAAGRK